jgi:hypothetical protein
MIDPDIPEGIRPLCAIFLDGLHAVLPDNLFGVYLYGAWAFPESASRGDVDLHVILKQALNGSEKSALGDLHATLVREFPSLVGEGLDAYYLLVDDVRGTTPPRHQLLDDVVDSSWALHSAHLRAGRCIILYGPDPKELFPEASWDELEAALNGELDYVKEHLTDYPAYCVLNLCRLMYSFDTRDVVVSKHRSARWALEIFPDKESLIEAAISVYEGDATAAQKRNLVSEITGFFEFACDRIEESRGRSPAT